LKWEIDDNKQIHQQLIDGITRRIFEGIYKPGDKIPSVRDLAIEARVNPNTIQKALQELEDNKILETRRTIGKFITKDVKRLMKIKENLSSEIAQKFIKEMRILGIGNEEIKNIIEREIKK